MKKNKPKVITLGYGRHFFEEGNLERERMLACAAKTKSLDIIIFTFKSDGLSSDRAGDNLVFHPTNSSSKLTAVWDAFQIASEIIAKEENPNQVIVSTQDPFEAGLVGYLLKRRFGISLSVQEHADAFSLPYWRQESFLNQIRFRIGSWVIKKADTVRVVADRITETLCRRGVKKETIRKLPVAINLSTFASAKSSDEVKKIFPGKTFVFLWVGRFVDQKNLPLMIDSFAEVYVSNPDIRLLMVGSGQKEDDINKLISEKFGDLSPEDCPVQILPWSGDVAGLMKASDAYLLTSNYEGWARVLIESMLQRLPIVTTDVGCVHEVVKDREHGLVAPVDDLEGLVNAMNEIVTNKELYSSFKTNLEALSLESIPGTNIDEYAGLWVKTLC